MKSDYNLFDLSFLEAMDDENFIIELISLYLQDTEIDLEDMESALATGDFSTIYGLAHKLKSSTGMLQANELYVILEQTELIAKNGGGNNQISKLVQMAQYEFTRLKAALELHLKSIQVAV